MQKALALAALGQYTARPNPCVGAVIVRENQIVGEGHHAYYGGEHAEVVALKQAGKHAQGATCYVTLEPCAHQGKTPPCTNALIEAGIQRVVVASQDPNPLVRGKGIAALRAAGIEVDIGLLAISAQQLNRAFMYRMKHEKPYVIMKSAMSLDGRTAMEDGTSKWITGAHARERVQHLRAQSDAIVTGAGTVLADNPSMNVRLESIIAKHRFKQPKRIVLDTHAKTADPKMYTLPGESSVVSANDHPLGPDGLCLNTRLARMHDEGINQLMVEAGSRLTAAFIQQSLVNEWHVFIAPKIMGKKAKPVCDMDIENMADAHGMVLKSLKP